MERYLDLLARRLAAGPLAAHADALIAQARGTVLRHGRRQEWQSALDQLPVISGAPELDLTTPCVSVGPPLEGETRRELVTALQRFHPWRKGPFCIHGVHVDSEWRSDWKWARVAPHIEPLAGRRVLDVGCGNGYYGWRMLGAGACEVLGLDPTMLYFAQFCAVRHFIGETALDLLPIGIEALPAGLHAFDTVFSMGVIYHRRDPLAHLGELRSALRRGGQLVIESLVIEGGPHEALAPGERYAKMKNVHLIPSVRMLAQWLAETGFDDVRCVDVTRLSHDEQRATDWMRFESLADFLDPSDPDRTVEGHPAPIRAVLVALAT